MKKFLSMLLAVLQLLPMLPAMADGAKETLPEEIAALFDVLAWKEYEVPYTTANPNKLAYIWIDHADFGLVLQSKKGLNVLCVIERSSEGVLRITQRNYTMIPDDYVPIFDSTPYQTPTENTVTIDIYGDDYYYDMRKIKGVWRVTTVKDYDGMFEASVSTDKIIYCEIFQSGDYLLTDPESDETAYGTFDNRFAGFNISDFPKTVEEARAKLTNPPLTPSDFYTPEVITLRAGEQYDVFSAPGRDSYRAANGKAVMSTNDWVQVFGEEDGWLLVQYDISSDRMRFGYIDASALPKNTSVQTLRWYDLPQQTVKFDTSVTDDPLCSETSIHQLKAGAQVKVLSSFGMWYYIEATNLYGETLRGFIWKSAIDLITWDDMKG